MSCDKKHAYLYSCTVGAQNTAGHVVSCHPPGADGGASDAVKLEVSAHAQAKLGTGSTTCDYIHPVKVDAKDDGWISRRMASNCAPHYSLSEVRHVNHFKCHYMGEGVDADGKVIKNPYKSWKGRLPSCDDASLEVSDDVMDDIRSLAYYAADGEASKMDKSQFVCEVMSTPMM